MRARAENRKVWDRILPMLQGGKFQQCSATPPSRYGDRQDRQQRPEPPADARRREDIDAAMEEGMMEIVPRWKSAPTTSRPSPT